MPISHLIPFDLQLSLLANHQLVQTIVLLQLPIVVPYCGLALSELFLEMGNLTAEHCFPKDLFTGILSILEPKGGPRCLDWHELPLAGLDNRILDRHGKIL